MDMVAVAVAVTVIVDIVRPHEHYVRCTYVARLRFVDVGLYDNDQQQQPTTKKKKRNNK